MQAVEDDRDWWTRNVNDGNPVEKFSARELLHRMAESAWQCGDPGMQYDTTVNRWHTCKTTARINASNPCSEYMFLDDTACNLASLNLMKYLNSNGTFDVEAFRHAVDITITAQEILVDNASYPTPRIAENSHKFRPLGLGYANLGALLMSMALPYDSDGGRDMAGAVTALMCGEAYAQSARIAERLGPFAGYAANREPMLDVIRMHRDSLRPIKPENVQPSLLGAAQTSWDTALALGEKFGYKNSQVTVLAPTGTIGFMMDCDTTGVEPDLALVKYKKLVGGGVIKIVNNTVPAALMKLGYSPEETSQIVSYIDRNGKIEGAPGFKPEHLAVFDCSLAAVGGRSIAWRGHLKMMAAAQPFLSGAISKTINMPEESTVEDIMQAYIESWKLGVKAVAIYRDNSKGSQPLSAAGDKKDTAQQTQIAARSLPKRVTGRANSASSSCARIAASCPASAPPSRTNSPSAATKATSPSACTKTGEPGEIFIKMAKEGSTLSGFMDGFALSVSIGLQYGVPLKALVDKFINTRFEPAGYTGHPAIPYAKSVLDYIARWLGGRFISPDYLTHNGGHCRSAASCRRRRSPAPSSRRRMQLPTRTPSPRPAHPRPMFDGAPTCSECGMLMTPNGACYKCENCGGPPAAARPRHRIRISAKGTANRAFLL